METAAIRGSLKRRVYFGGFYAFAWAVGVFTWEKRGGEKCDDTSRTGRTGDRKRGPVSTHYVFLKHHCNDCQRYFELFYSMICWLLSAYVFSFAFGTLVLVGIGGERDTPLVPSWSGTRHHWLPARVVWTDVTYYILYIYRYIHISLLYTLFSRYCITWYIRMYLIRTGEGRARFLRRSTTKSSDHTFSQAIRPSSRL